MSEPAKMIYLIRRRADASREELVAHWFANHMPGVISAMDRARQSGKPHASRYIATLFDPLPDGTWPWDGMAQLWWDFVLPMPAEPHGTTPADSFQQKAEPYTPWATRETVVLDGELPVEPLTLNDPFPTTRSSFYKATFMLPGLPDTDHDRFYDYWTQVHAPNVVAAMKRVGGIRYCMNHSIDPGSAPYLGMAELWFPDETAWHEFMDVLVHDDLHTLYDRENLLIVGSRTEMIGIG